MFCPKCATQNVEGASYCRTCGANISLVPQALTGSLQTEDRDDDGRFSRRWRRQPSADHATRSLIMGVVFAVMAVTVFRYNPGSARWWFWILVPAMMLFSRGITEWMRIRRRRNESPKLAGPMVNAVRPTELRNPQTGELMPPMSSVTEGTTRHLGTDAKTRPFEFSDTRKPS